MSSCSCWRSPTFLPEIFGEEVLVEIAVGVAVCHVDAVEHVHHTGEQGRAGDGEPGVLHVLAVGGAVAEGAEEGEDLLGDGLEHHRWFGVLEFIPAQVRLAGKEDGALDHAAGEARLLLGEV